MAFFEHFKFMVSGEIGLNMTAQNVFNKAMALIDEVTKDGLPDPNTTKDYEGKAVLLIDSIQKELLIKSNLLKVQKILVSPVKNMIIGGDNIDEFIGVPLTYIVTGAARAYYFEVDGSCTCAIDGFEGGSWHNRITFLINNEDYGFKSVRGIIPNSWDDQLSRVRFTSETYFRTVNRALYSISYLPEQIPSWGKFVFVNVSDDIATIHKILTDRPYDINNIYKIESCNNKVVIKVSNDYCGILEIHYTPFPKDIISLSDPLELDSLQGDIIAYGLAQYICANNGDAALAAMFKSKFEGMKSVLIRRTPANWVKTVNNYI